MSTAKSATAPRGRLPLEPEGPDFPYHRDDPPTISLRGWLMIFAGVAGGFAALVTPLPFSDDVATGWFRVTAFVGFPLMALAIAARRRWMALFRPVGWREVKLMLVFALLNILISMTIGSVIETFGTTASNARMADAVDYHGGQLIAFFANVGLQLLGEELITILPFLGLIVLFHARAGIGRNLSVFVAWLLSSMAFGLAHLPTYNWNIVQCLVVIGSARLVLTWAYVWSKNIWVSTGAHIINDWAILAATIFLTPLVATS